MAAWVTWAAWATSRCEVGKEFIFESAKFFSQRVALRTHGQMRTFKGHSRVANFAYDYVSVGDLHDHRRKGVD